MWEKGADDEVFSRKPSQKLLPNVFCFVFCVVSFVFVVPIVVVVMAEKHSKRRPSMWFLLFSFVRE